MTRTILLVTCLLVVVNAGTYGGQKIGLEDIERDLNANQKTTSHVQPKGINMAVSSPTKFGYVPKRTASSYAATKPKPQYLQTHYKVKQVSQQVQPSYQPQLSYQAQPTQYQQQYTTAYTQPQPSYQQQYSTASSQHYAAPSSSSSSNYAAQYSSGEQQYVPQQQGQEYAYAQPEIQQQYAVQYQQPGQQYEQYENVQYIADNSIAKTESQPQQYYAQQPQPQYYYVQQQSPSIAVESIIDPKAFQYVYLPSYSQNSIPIDQKQVEAYSTGSELQLPPVTTTVAKYTKVIPRPSKGSSSKQYDSQKEVQYVVPSAKTQHYKNDEGLFKREPKSLLDSYVPSYVQLQYLKQQGKSAEYAKF